jgi:hypothetical protein
MGFKLNSPCGCCGGTPQIRWIYTDQGFILGGQNGALRTYLTPGAVAASPWVLGNDGLRLRCNFENDSNCTAQHGPPYNPYNQIATATATLTLTVETELVVSWAGLGERQATTFDRMELQIDGILRASARSPGNVPPLGCAPMGPVVSTPPSPVTITLPAGGHTLFVLATTGDSLYHYGSYYQFDLVFTPPIVVPP